MLAHLPRIVILTIPLNMSLINKNIFHVTLFVCVIENAEINQQVIQSRVVWKEIQV
jgi:hypothetical protein